MTRALGIVIYAAILFVVGYLGLVWTLVALAGVQ